jgi:hypothetical protein
MQCGLTVRWPAHECRPVFGVGETRSEESKDMVLRKDSRGKPYPSAWWWDTV